MPTVTFDLSCSPCCNILCDYGIGCTLFEPTLHATLSDSGGCACLDGLVIPLVYNATTQEYFGSAAVCNDNGCMINIYLDCFAGGLEADCVGCNGATDMVCVGFIAQVNVGGSTCDPLLLNYFIPWNDRFNNPCQEGHMCCTSPAGSFHINITL